MKRNSLFFLMLFIALFGLGFIPWPITGAVQWLCGRLVQLQGISISAKEAYWTPWRAIRLKELTVQKIQGNGQLTVSKLTVSTSFPSFLRDHLMTNWDMEDLRIEPVSWGIRDPMIREILSAIPLATHGNAILMMNLHETNCPKFELQGFFLRMNGDGWIKKSETHLEIHGTMASVLLKQMHWIKSTHNGNIVWEPFRFRLDGPLSKPEVSFTSNFYSISLKTHGE